MTGASVQRYFAMRLTATRRVTLTVLVAIIAIARLGSIADQGTAYAADRCAHCRATNIARDSAAKDRTGNGTDRSSLFSLRAACKRQADQRKYDCLFHETLSNVTMSSSAR
ncbi:conserved exported hypothetical protein [Agrobacterium genomosp. 5 str. CFBP 6626]|nr:conserved exported hypothetical protein [Agrobacterium genomosp. 5 str. CFBP 6626]